MNRNPQQIYWASVAVWGLFVVGHLVWHLWRAFAALPTDEVYANGLGFQLAAFGLTKLPFWLLGLVALLLAEFFLFRRR
jgi:ABC-type Fe3+-siderophore transport system permease subunit